MILIVHSPCLVVRSTKNPQRASPAPHEKFVAPAYSAALESAFGARRAFKHPFLSAFKRKWKDFLGGYIYMGMGQYLLIPFLVG
jgi:hypothetical protein